jgi:hypothetical protein
MNFLDKQTQEAQHIPSNETKSSNGTDKPKQTAIRSAIPFISKTQKNIEATKQAENFVEDESGLKKEDINEIIKDINRTKKIKTRLICETKETTAFDIIDLYSLNNRKGSIEKHEIILSILEVIVNWKKYGFREYNSKIWDKVINLKLGNKIFAELNFTQLKKYASLLKSIRDKKAVIAMIEKYKNVINEEKK